MYSVKCASTGVGVCLSKDRLSLSHSLWVVPGLVQSRWVTRCSAACVRGNTKIDWAPAAG